MKVSDKSYKGNVNMKRLIVLITIILSISNVVSAQECGPSCPVCSGSTDGSLLSAGSFLFSGISIPGGEEETGVLSFRYGAFSRIDLGAGYSFKSEEVIWNARFQALKEDEESWKPGIILGTGSVRTGKSDQSLYIHLTKSWEFSENFSLRFTAGMAKNLLSFDNSAGSLYNYCCVYLAESRYVFAHSDFKSCIVPKQRYLPAFHQTKIHYYSHAGSGFYRRRYNECRTNARRYRRVLLANIQSAVFCNPVLAEFRVGNHHDCSFGIFLLFSLFQKT